MGHSCSWLEYRSPGGVLEGVLPLTQIKSWLFGHSFIAPAFAVYGGPLSMNDTAKHALIEAAKDMARNAGAHALELRSQVRQCPDWPSKTQTYATFRKGIHASADENMSAIPRKQRAMVRKGLKLGLTHDIAAEIDEGYALYAHSVRNLGTPVFPKRWFQALKDLYGDMCDVLIVRKGQEALSGVLSFYFKGEVIPYYGGGTAAARLYAANDYMYWALMEHARERGCRSFDFGRSKVGSGAYAFKKNWGFMPSLLTYEYYLPASAALPDLSPLNPKYKAMIALWRKLPLFAANRLGPMIARNLG